MKNYTNRTYTIKMEFIQYKRKKKLRRRDRQHINHKIYLKFSEMVFKVMNFNLVKKKSNISDLNFQYFLKTFYRALLCKEIIRVLKWLRQSIPLKTGKRSNIATLTCHKN